MKRNKWGVQEIACGLCGGKGWTAPPAGVATWANECRACRGACKFTVYSAGRRLKIDGRTIARVLEGKGKAETRDRVLAAFRGSFGFLPAGFGP